MPIPLGILAVAGAGAAGAGAYDLLETTVLSSNATTVTFTGLGSYSEYKHLQLRIVVRGTTIGIADNDTLLIRLNSDTGNNYLYHQLSGNGSSVSSSGELDFPFFVLQDLVPTGDTTANNFGVACVDILDFSNANKFTTIRSLHGAVNSSETDIMLQSGLWRNTASITSITLLYLSTAVIGSRFSLYGIK